MSSRTPASRLLFAGDFGASRVGNLSVAEELIGHLERRGWSCHALGRSSSSLARSLEMLAGIWRWRRRAGLVSIDVFSGRAFLWAEAASALAHRVGLRQIAVLHGGGLAAMAARRPARVRHLLARVDAAVAPSAYLANALRHLRRIEIIPNGLEMSRYPFRERSGSPPTLIWLRAFGRLYRPEMAAAVFERVQAEVDGARLTMVGADRRDGSLATTRAALARHTGAGRAEILPAQPKARLPEILDAHEIFLNTSRIDNAPVTVTEALACGLPVVSTAVGGLPHLIEQDACGLLAPADDVAGLADSIVRLHREPDLARRLSREGRQRAETMDWAAVVPRWERLYRSLLGGPE